MAFQVPRKVVSRARTCCLPIVTCTCLRNTVCHSMSALTIKSSGPKCQPMCLLVFVLQGDSALGPSGGAFMRVLPFVTVETRRQGYHFKFLYA